MCEQKIFGLLVTEQKIPFIEKAEKSDHCYLCGFSFKDGEDCMIVFSDEELNTRKRIHGKCLQNHLILNPKGEEIALVNMKTNEVMTYSNLKE